jgi:soluble lytic murein transglycosylase-like protein
MDRKWFILLGIGLIGLLYFYKESVYQSIETGVSWMMGLYDEIYQKWAAMRGIDWKLLKAVSIVESSENPNAVGDEGRSIGLMQISLIVGGSYGMNNEDLLNPDLNVQVGSGFLKEMIDKYGLEGGIQAYNLGETKFRKGLTSPVYLDKVMNEFLSLQGTEVV